VKRRHRSVQMTCSFVFGCLENMKEKEERKFFGRKIGFSETKTPERGRSSWEMVDE
jgi:hypothetical protein